MVAWSKMGVVNHELEYPMLPVVDHRPGSHEIVPGSSVVSSHATSQGLIIYYRKDDGTLGVMLEPRQVMPKQVILDRSA